MTTVKNLIEQLQKIEDQDQSVIFQYYIAEHFIDPITDDNMEPKDFVDVVEAFDDKSEYVWDSVFEEVVNTINEVQNDRG